MDNQSLTNKQLRKKRTMRYFIDAACAIIAEQGVGAVNIRNVSARAGYSSASIYKYFANMNQLIAFAAINSLQDFVEDLRLYIGPNANPLERYVLSWYCFSIHTFRNPELYSAVFIHYGTDIFTFLDEYYTLFPEERKDFPDDIQQSFFSKDLFVRTRQLLQQCAASGLLRYEEIDDISDYANASFEGFMQRLQKDPKRYNADFFVRMLCRLLEGYNPQLAPLLHKIPFPPIEGNVSNLSGAV